MSRLILFDFIQMLRWTSRLNLFDFNQMLGWACPNFRFFLHKYFDGHILIFYFLFSRQVLECLTFLIFYFHFLSSQILWWTYPNFLFSVFSKNAWMSNMSNFLFLLHRMPWCLTNLFLSSISISNLLEFDCTLSDYFGFVMISLFHHSIFNNLQLGSIYNLRVITLGVLNAKFLAFSAHARTHKKKKKITCITCSKY